MYIAFGVDDTVPLEEGTVSILFGQNSVAGVKEIVMNIMKSGRVECEPETWEAVVRDKEIIGLREVEE